MRDRVYEERTEEKKECYLTKSFSIIVSNCAHSFPNHAGCIRRRYELQSGK